MGIKTKVERRKREINSQNHVVKDYAVQLKSKVISNSHRKAILKELQLEMTADAFRKPVRCVYKHNAIRTFGNDVEPYDISETENQPTFNAIQTGGQAVEAVQKQVNNEYIKSQRSTGYIHTAQLRFTGDAKKVVDEARTAETRYNEELRKQRLKMVVSSERKKETWREAEIKRHKATEKQVVSTTAENPKSDFKSSPEAVKQKSYIGDNSGNSSEHENRKIVTATSSENNDVVAEPLESAAIETDKPKKKRRKRRKHKKAVNYELKNQKYSTVKSDSEDSLVIEAAQTVAASVATVAQVGGYIRTAVGGTGKAAGKIATAVKSGHIFSRKSSIKDFGHIATAVSSSVTNIAKDTGQQLIRTKIDKSTVTDTGTEAIKQGLTEMRYVDNARKAVLNTARTTVKAVRTLKNMPRDTKQQVKKIKKKAKKAKKTVETAGKVIGKILTSPVGKYILLAAGIIFLIIFLIMLIVTVIMAIVNSLFGWLGGSFGDGLHMNAGEVYSGYTASVNAHVDAIRNEIHEVVDEFVCDRRQFQPYDEITELNQFGNKTLNDIDSNEVIAILATLHYRDSGSDTGISEMMFTDAEIAEVVGKYYDFNYYYTYGHCDGCEQGHLQGGGTYIYCDVDHAWLHGEVINYTLDEVLESLEFTDEERNMYEMFYGQIAMFGGG